MKKVVLFSFAALFALSVSSCGKEGGEGGTGDTTKPAVTTPTTPTDPAAQTDPNADPTVDPNMPITTVAFPEDNHDFGEIKAGTKVTHEYKFKNTGTQPLKVFNVKPSCGCTTPDWTKEPIAPGAEGFIKVEFDSANKTGIQKKSVTVTMNTEPRIKVLNFSGEVKDDGSGAAHSKDDGHGH